MRKWEQLYDYYKSDKAKERIDFLKSKIDEKQATPDEVKEYNKMKKVVGYLPEVENLIEGIKALEDNLEILKEEFYAREDEAKSKRKASSLENKASKLETEIETDRKAAQKILEDIKDKIQKEINDRQVKIESLEKDNGDGKHDDEIAKLQEEQEGLREQKKSEKDRYDKAVFAIQEKEEKLRGYEEIKESVEQKEAKHPELANLSKTQLRKEIFKTAGQISRCNFAARCFMQGYSRQTIDLKVNREWKNRTFTAKDPLPLTRKEREQKKGEKAAEKTNDSPKVIEKIEEKKNDIQTESKKDDDKQQSDATSKIQLEATRVIQEGFKPLVENIKSKSKSNDDYSNDPTKTQALIDIEQIKSEHPILSRLSRVPGLGRIATRRLNKIIEQAYKEKRAEVKAQVEAQAETQVEAKTAEQEEQTQFKSKRSEFIKGLSDYNVMDIAEKGVNGIESERKTDKLKAAKEAAMERQNKKFGDAYSERSGDKAQTEARYNDDENER